MSDKPVRIEVDKYGTIYIYNTNNKVHSFNNKPAVITADGYLAWYDHGTLFKVVYPF